MRFKKTTLPSGLRIITIPVKTPTVTTMVVCETGSNYESKKENGLAHFLEHMVFKGTPNRPTAQEVYLALDRVGAESNAFTANEMTAYYAKGERRHWKSLLDVIADIYLHPTLPAPELEKERGVITQEISMYEDLPQRLVWDVLTGLMYGDTPAGRTILGPKENIKNFTQKEFLAYRKKHYVAKSTIVVVAGDVTPKAVEAEVRKLFKTIALGKKATKDRVREKQATPGLALRKKSSDQTHLVMGFRSVSARDKRSPAVAVLMGILGDGFSSRLFLKMREELGICYFVRAAHDHYTDHGYAAIYAGVDKQRLEEAVTTILNECAKLKTELVSDDELQKTKDYVVSHLYMHLETSDNVAAFVANEEITAGSARLGDEMEKEIRTVTAEDVRKAARLLFVDEKLNLAVVGDAAGEAGLKKALTFKKV